jgi:methylenetetrahydrofolate reductase (NADPH)
MFWRFFLPGGYRPDRLIERLAPSLVSPDDDIEGFHFFTFNELERTEAWRQAWLGRLSSALDGEQGVGRTSPDDPAAEVDRDR